MYVLGNKSREKLVGVHPLLVQVIHGVMSLQVMDFSVNEGVRTLERQRQLVKEGKSKTLDSKHLKQSDGYGHAADLYPHPVNMPLVHKNDPREIFRFGVLCGLMLAEAKRQGVLVVNGADWDGDGETLDHTFFDAPHFQLVLR